MFTSPRLGFIILLQGLQVWNPNMKHTHTPRSWQPSSLPSVQYIESHFWVLADLIMDSIRQILLGLKNHLHVSTVPAASSGFASQRLLAILLLSFASFLHLFMPLTACFYTWKTRPLTAWLKRDFQRIITQAFFALEVFMPMFFNCKKCDHAFNSHPLNITFLHCFMS